MCLLWTAQIPGGEPGGVEFSLHEQNPFQKCLSWALPERLCLVTAYSQWHPLPSFPPHKGEPKGQELLLSSTPHPAIVVTSWHHFVLHLIPFERGHWRIAGEGRQEERQKCTPTKK